MTISIEEDLRLLEQKGGTKKHDAVLKLDFIKERITDTIPWKG